VDDAAFALTADLFVLHQAGIRELLPAGKMLPGERHLGRAPWSGFLAKVPPAPMMVWTYRELGSDLCGRADPARGALWRELIKLLELPRGSVAFWPFALPAKGEGDEVWMEPFLAGLARIAPKALVVFGEEASPPIAAALSEAENEALADIRSLCVPWTGAQSANQLAQPLRQFLNTMEASR